MEEKIIIKNRNDHKIKVIIDVKKDQENIVFIMPGLSGHTEQLHIKAFKEAFDKENITTIIFDPGNSYGESYGSLEDATVTQQLSDLEDVIKWAQSQDFYEEPFYLAGHSLGSFCALLYAEKFPEKIKAIAPISTVVSGKMNLERYPKEMISQWKKEGVREWKSYSGHTKRLKWNYMEDGSKYNVLTEIEKIKIPVLLIVGEKDIETPLTDNTILYKNLQGKKELHVIKEAEHTFRELHHLEEIKQIIVKWINTVK